MDVALIDAGGANLGSVRYALARLGIEARLVREGSELGDPDRIVLPGVGAAAEAMRLLDARGLSAALRAHTAPMLGICLGMQLLYEHSEEGDVTCLGLLPGRVRMMRPQIGIRVPHMGWNAIHRVRASFLLEGVEVGAQAYFVHGFAVQVGGECVAASTHGEDFTAMVHQGRICGTQFHPERSSSLGARVLANFVRWAA